MFSVWTGKQGLRRFIEPKSKPHGAREGIVGQSRELGFNWYVLQIRMKDGPPVTVHLLRPAPARFRRFRTASQGDAKGGVEAGHRIANALQWGPCVTLALISKRLRAASRS